MKKRLGLGGLVAVIGGAYMGGNIYATQQAEIKLAEMQNEALASGIAIKYNDISANVFGRVTVSGITVSQPGVKYTMDEVTVSGMDGDREELGDVYLNVKAFKMLVDEAAGQQLGMQMMPGIVTSVMGENPISMDIIVDVSSSEKAFSVNELSLSGAGFGFVSFSLAIEMDAPMKRDVDAVMGAMGNIKIHDVTLSVQDGGFIDRLLAEQTTATDISAFKTQMIDDLRFKDYASEVEMMFASAAIGVIEGRHMKISRQSNEPFIFNMQAMIMSPGQLISTAQNKMDLRLDTIEVITFSK